MLDKKALSELEKLKKIAEKQDYKLNAMLLYNVLAAFSGSHDGEELFQDMQGYLNDHNIEIIFDDVEVESEETIFSKKIRPFDPSKIDISMQQMSLDSLLKRIANEEIDLNTEFQRRGGLWSQVQKSQLIESLLLKIPLPAFYFDAGVEDKWLIIDGLQRITALKEFTIDKTLKLKGLEFFGDLEGIGYDELPRVFVRRIEETNLVAFTVKRGTPVNVKYNIFKRINTGGLELEPQEIRHALYQGKAVKMLKHLSETEEFKKATGGSIRIDRMQDQEFVLRFVAVCFYGINKYDSSSEDFLNDAMAFLNDTDDDTDKEICKKFCQVMQDAYEILGCHAFRKISLDGMRRPINKAIYEAWCYNLFMMEEKEIRGLKFERGKVKNKFIELCDDDSFLAALKHSDKKSVIYRFDCIYGLTREVLYDKGN